MIKYENETIIADLNCAGTDVEYAVISINQPRLGSVKVAISASNGMLCVENDTGEKRAFDSAKMFNLMLLDDNKPILNHYHEQSFINTRKLIPLNVELLATVMEIISEIAGGNRHIEGIARYRELDGAKVPNNNEIESGYLQHVVYRNSDAVVVHCADTATLADEYMAERFRLGQQDLGFNCIRVKAGTPKIELIGKAVYDVALNRIGTIKPFDKMFS